MGIEFMSIEQRQLAARTLDREAAALGVDRSLFAPAKSQRALSGHVAGWARERAPNWSVALDSAGYPAPLAAAIEAAHRRARP